MRLEVENDLPLDKSEIINILSGGRKKTGLSHSMLNRLEDMINIGREYFQPKAVYDIFNTEELPDLPYFKEAEEVALAVCTIGSKLPAVVKEFMNKGQLVDGTLLDAIGSIAADALADKINEEINEVALKKSLETTLRYSPGYCTWPLTGQSLIFERLATDEIGVTLTDSFLMTPVKSVSFAVNIGKDVKNSSWELRCRTCKKVCSYRRNI
jgi:hypothetical protein